VYGTVTYPALSWLDITVIVSSDDGSTCLALRVRPQPSLSLGADMSLNLNVGVFREGSADSSAALHVISNGNLEWVPFFWAVKILEQ